MNITAEANAVLGDCGSIRIHGGKAPMPFNEAVSAAVAAALPPTASERLPLSHAIGRVLAADATAPASLPRFDHSAMDGFAVRTADFAGSGPWSLKVVRRVAAGDATGGSVSHEGTAVEIFTGAPVPPGYDTVVVRERCSSLGPDGIITSAKPRLGENIRRRGEDVEKDAEVASSGAIVTPHLTALFAALGITEVMVRPKVRIAVLATGSELRRPGELLDAGQIYDSNSYMAAGMLSQPWIEYTDLGRVHDDLNSISETVRSASGTYDVLITSGGMSHGGADHIRTVLEANGARLDVLQVAMRPGKPATIGRVGRALFVGLPGNPLAAAVVLSQIALPAIKRTGGLREWEAQWIQAVLSSSYSKRAGRTEFAPVEVSGRDEFGRPVVTVLGRGSSGSLLPMARATGLAVMSEDVTELHAGCPLRYLPFQS
ncbi:gephyrin-like molybdotransferase Glp [Rhizobium sp. LC145]|uniref:molybdopterin molybdotransferase MoeA n=1 Tax=Rhizobium sp. LC145 TaxID=1120688 RepID=UPI000A53E0A1|nr:gephyrin-like molybdotransferase Glp [Rhizobium sp. LC145]MDX3927884.1 molybdopterin molybdotransferase MoeA [Shinella sp.]